MDDQVANRPVLTIGGFRRASRNVAFITENWIFPADGASFALTTYGIRFLGERLSADLAFGNLLCGGAQSLVPGIPLVGFAYKV